MESTQKKKKYDTCTSNFHHGDAVRSHMRVFFIYFGATFDPEINNYCAYSHHVIPNKKVCEIKFARKQ